jgi:hypothetical protein
MRTYAKRLVAVVAVAGASLAVILAVYLSGAASSRAGDQQVEEASSMMNNFEAEQRAADVAREKDTAWKPSCSEVGLIQIGNSKQPGSLKNFCLNADGNLLACVVPTEVSAQSPGAIRVYSPKGALLTTMPLEIRPGAICVAKDGSIFVAGDGRVLKLDPSGKVLASADSPVAKEKVVLGKDAEDMVKQMAAQEHRPLADALAQIRGHLEQRRAEVTGLAVTEEDLFLAAPSTSDYTFRVYRFDHALQNPKLVVEKLRGCCGQMDVQAHDGKLWIPHNARHTVENLDRDGKQLSKFGKTGRVKASDFGGCCEPKNLRVLTDGDILAAESGPPTCIKRFSATGQFKEVLAVTKGSKGDCVRVTVEASPDGKQYYMLDTTRDAIRVFAKRS